MATNYQRGRAFEYRTRDKLKKDGAVYVMRAAQSKGIADLLVLWPWNDYTCPDCGSGLEEPWLVQCKRDGRLPAREEIELVSVAEAAGAKAVLAKTGKNGRGVEFIHLPRQEV